MGVEKEIIVALEFGTSAIRGIAGKKKPDGTIQILAIEQERANDAIQRGVIYNIDKTTLAITSIVQRINERLNAKVSRAYVGVSGQSLHSASNFISRGLEMKVKITPELVDNLMDNNRATEYTDSQILDVVPQEYIVGNRPIADPVGIQSDQIEARFINVIAKNALLENIHKCMRMAGIEIADLFISPMTLADALLSDSEKRSGCAMIDFGAGTTSVTVYNGNILRHLVVIPLGGNNITNDIATSQQMEFEEAETLKRKYGIAYVAAESDNPQMLPISNDRTLSENDLQYIIGARQEEIIMNVWNQIKNVSDRLLSGIVITGGAAQLQDIPEAIKHFTQFQKVKMAKSLITTAEVAPGVIAPQGISIDTLIAMLAKGNTNCVEEIDGQPIIDGSEETLSEVDENGELAAENEQTSPEESIVNKKPKKPLLDRFVNLMQDMFVEKDDEQESK
ncbi:MAG: cell division protein FtsA [Bacteroidaceae bacterium]|nr:cell division protein FtsA [Bacteroidaceae bacterium]